MGLATQRATSQLAFRNYQTVKKLHALAEHPFDLAQDESITPERIAKYTAESCGYKLLYGTQRISDEVIEALRDLAKEAKVLEKMKQMQDGVVINLIEGYPSDNRSVLHTAMRDIFEKKQHPKNVEEAISKALKEHEKLKAFVNKFEAEKKFTEVVCVAMGGSDLGPKAVYYALQYLQKPGRNIHFISNIDPDATAKVVKDLDLSKTLFIIGSKSGTTIETASNEEFVRQILKKAGLNPEQQMVAITQQGSAIDDRTKFLECFYIWDFVGGRFCTTSMFGGVLFSLAFGYDVYYEFLRGANAMDKAALNEDINQNLPLLLALLGVWNRNFLNLPTLALVPYSEALFRFPAHIQQVDMESNGKHIDRHGNVVDFETGPIVWGEPGTSAQHSFYQLIHQGTSILPLELIGFKESQYGEDATFKGSTNQQKLFANLIAQGIALAGGHKNENPNKVFQGNRPVSMLVAKKLTPYTMGVLFALYEHKVAFQGFIWDINSFDQEGVMLGKVLAEKVLADIVEHDKGDLRKAKELYPLGEAFLEQFDRL